MKGMQRRALGRDGRGNPGRCRKGPTSQSTLLLDIETPQQPQVHCSILLPPCLTRITLPARATMMTGRPEASEYMTCAGGQKTGRGRRVHTGMGTARAAAQRAACLNPGMLPWASAACESPDQQHRF